MSATTAKADQREDTGDECSSDLISWKKRIDLSIASSRKIRGANYVQLATVDTTSSEPRCRTVVFRGFLPHPSSSSSSSSSPEKIDESCVMKMITDLRSKKVTEGSSGNRIAEIVWWFAKSSEQYRVRGKLQFVGYDEIDEFLSRARKEQWGNLSDPAREQFFWHEPSAPFQPLESIPTGGRDDGGKILQPPENFLLMLLHPFWTDYLRLGDNYHQIDELVHGQWKMERVNP